MWSGTYQNDGNSPIQYLSLSLRPLNPMFQANSELRITEFVAASCWTSRRLQPL